MLAGYAFLTFGFLAGLAYLAYHQERQLVALGLLGLGVAAGLNGFEVLIGTDDGAAQAVSTLLAIIRHISMGAGLSFLAYVAGTEGWRFYGDWKRRREAEIEAYRAGLTLPSQHKAEPSRAHAAR